MAKPYHPPTTLDLFKQDENTSGKPSDHNVAIVAPKSNNIERHKQVIHMRLQPTSRLTAFIREVGAHERTEVLKLEDPDEQAHNFHQTITSIFEKNSCQKY